MSHRQLNRQLPIRFLNLLFSQLYLTLGPRVTQEKPILVLQSGQHIRCREFIFKYLFPILAFALGVLVADLIQKKFKYFKKIHWRQGILLFEIIILFAVGFMPKSMDTVAAVIVSFSCAMQVQTFRKVRGYSYASTMCIGNLRSGTAALSGFIHERKPEQLRQAMYYFGVIFFFAVGAGLGGNLSLSFGTHIIWVSCGLLLVSFLMMFKEKIQ